MEKKKRQQDCRVDITVTHRYETDRFGRLVRNFMLVVLMLLMCFGLVMIVLCILGLV